MVKSNKSDLKEKEWLAKQVRKLPCFCDKRKKSEKERMVCGEKCPRPQEYT